MRLTIRPATSADAPAIVEANRRLAAETEDKVLDLVVLERGVARVLADATRGRYLVADDGERVVGQLMLTWEWSDWRDGWFWWIQSVYVWPEARGQGVFRRLYEQVIGEARTAGNVVGIRLYVENANKAAQETYYRLGMKQAGYFVLEQKVE
jgi:ribosomal protein S18 acetylase RimI-like enzyme